MAKRGAPGDPGHPGTYVRSHVFPAGMTVTKAAKLLGIGRPALSNFLNGKAALSQEMARRLEHAFGANREDLLDLQARYDRRDEAMRTSVVAGRHAPTLVEIKAHRIEKWAETIRAREDLPAMLRRLVITTGGKLTRIDFPAFDNAQRPGWDGVVDVLAPTLWIPGGRSGWEFGCNGKPGSKANRDYEKRTNTLPPDERRDTTFVFVTPRNWHGKGKWVAEKAALGEWKDVRAYDASDLEQWLEQSAETQVWFAERLGEPVSGFRSPDMCWSDWADVCQPPLSPSLFSSENGAFADLERWLDAPPRRPFIISADSPDEALAFACHLARESKSGADELGMGALVFDTPEAMRRFRASNTVPRIAIVHNAQVEKEIGDLYRRCHCIIVRPANDIEGNPDIRLGLPGWKDFSDALEAMGMSDDRIDRLARESGRSPAVLRRRLSCVPGIRVPSWAKDEQTGGKLLPAALVGAWRDTSPADREVVRRLARWDDDRDVESGVMKLLDLPDSPLWSTGEYRGVVSRIDALFGIARIVTGPYLATFFSVAEEVLSEPDPALDLPEDERWLAAVHGKVRVHSAALREGIRQTLVLLAIHGDTLFRNRLGGDLEVRVSSLIRRLLTPLTLDKLLSHLGDLPDYAEAAPDTFLNLIEADLREPEPAVFGLLKPFKSGPLGEGQMRSGLLWALEGLGWKHLGRVSVILARLSTIPIDDNWANRPISSLEALYRPWLPRTAASLAERMQSLESLAKRFPDIGWQICIAQLNTGPQVEFPSHRPRWRDDAAGTGRGVTLEQFDEFRMKALNLILKWPKHDQGTLGDLVELLHDLPEKYQIETWDQIDAWAMGAETSDEAKAHLRERIRRFAFTRHGRRRGVRGEGLDRARAAYERLEPRDPLVRHSWLFVNFWVEPSADEVEEEDFDHKKRAELTRRLRLSAIKEIWSEHGIQGITTLLTKCAVPGVVGEALGTIIADADARVAFLRQCLLVPADPERHMDMCIQGFLASIEDDSRAAILAVAAQGVDTHGTARLFRCAPFRQHTWRLLDRHDPEVRDRYWQEVAPDWNRFTETELSELVDRLLDAKRPRAAFSATRLDWSKIDTQRLKRLLFDMATVDAEPADHYAPESYRISEAMRELDGRGDVARNEMAGLEFLYIETLDHSERGVPNLEQWVSESPIGFVQILAMVFKSDDGGQEPPEWKGRDDDNRAALAFAAYSLLDRISRIPGTKDGGGIDEGELSGWITEVRRRCANYGRARIGDQYIGQILSRGPSDEHGVRPCLAISEAMEAIGSQDIASGFVVGTLNAPGVFSRAIEEGGEQERELAKEYRGWAKQRSANYPYVGSILESIATAYDREASRQDDEAEIERRLGP